MGIQEKEILRTGENPFDDTSHPNLTLTYSKPNPNNPNHDSNQNV